MHHELINSRKRRIEHRIVNIDFFHPAAEVGEIIENTQRDVDLALINELTLIFKYKIILIDQKIQTELIQEFEFKEIAAMF